MSNETPLLQGVKALVTGAGRGIGVEIAKLLAAHGADVALSYRGSREGAEETAGVIRSGGRQAITLQADLSKKEDADRLVAETIAGLGGLDVLINNAAGFGPLKMLADHTWEEIDDEWQAVVRPVFLLTHAAMPHLRAQRHGRIVNLAAALVARPAPTYGAHVMAKAAVLGFTRTLAREVGQDGITVNAVSPGMTLTEFTQSLPEETREKVSSITPLRRLATSDDVARAIVFFASPLSDFVTGAEIAPDGGLAIL